MSDVTLSRLTTRKSSGFKLTSWACAISLVTMLSSVIWVQQEPSVGERVLSWFSPHRATSQENRVVDLKQRTGPTNNLPAPPSPEPAISLQRWQVIARQTFLQVVDPDSLTVSDAAMTLTALDQSQIQQLNEVFGKFIVSLQLEEIADAHVTSLSNGSEEIVVSPFDRSKLIETLRNDINSKIGEEVGVFVAEQAVYDRTLALNNSELRLCIERSDDGTDFVVFTQQALRQDAWSAEFPIRRGGVNFSPTFTQITKTFLRAVYQSVTRISFQRLTACLVSSASSG